ncbi:UDP-3-O-acyl-N-acetylglucosamine deacetylase [Candidatus Hepatincolaceae symbiont of Richtersius coronifer]
MSQITIKKAITIKGVGVHSGKSVNLRLLPAGIDTGIIFKRTDIKDPAQGVIPAKFDYVNDTKLCTVISNKYGHSVGTIEHLMSALYAFGVTNLIVEIDASEVPILDGSAALYVEELNKSGFEYQTAPNKILRILKPIEVKGEGWHVKFIPNNNLKLNLTIDFPNTIIGRQSFTYDADAEANLYAEDISKARTFALLNEIKYLNSISLALGGSLDNAIVVDKQEILNPGGLRYINEFVRHKILDGIGDLALCGYRIKGEFFGEKSGHKSNNMMLRAIFNDPSCYTIEEADLNSNMLLLGFTEMAFPRNFTSSNN